MIITKLSGGIGNQLFQYAAGFARSLKEHTTFKIDTRWYASQNKRSFSLNHFSITAPEAHILEILFTKYVQKNSYLTDYFQDISYFEHSEEALRKEFRLKEPLENKYPEIVHNITRTESVSVHVRRTDYIDKQHRYIVLTPEYYTNAMNHILSIKSGAVFYFFSDDIEWVQKNLPIPENSFFVSGKQYTDYEELGLMSLCKHNITANSTFSWWGAWLNTYTEKIIITPKKWFTQEVEQYISIPKSWIQI
jgi:hypothetical protein